MHLYSFLSALPALLALAGFVLYQVLGANKSGDQVSRRIVTKLRVAVPDEIPADSRLSAKQVEQLLNHQHRLKEVVGEQDFLLLRQALTQQFVITVLVYVLTLGFCAWSVYLFVKQPPEAKPVPAPTVQTSSGNGSPNVVSSGQGDVHVESSKTPASSSKSSKTTEPKK
jgi:hypothetical protein